MAIEILDRLLKQRDAITKAKQAYELARNTAFQEHRQFQELVKEALKAGGGIIGDTAYVVGDTVIILKLRHKTDSERRNVPFGTDFEQWWTHDLLVLPLGGK